mmetsp:Transcript_2023/g.5782  ORF Transcript_2023/g.5782 Transcript_2023/m.5782 type:complete len:200 (+) Transcript_2023:153-752(+)
MQPDVRGTTGYTKPHALDSRPQPAHGPRRGCPRDRAWPWVPTAITILALLRAHTGRGGDGRTHPLCIPTQGSRRPRQRVPALGGGDDNFSLAEQHYACQIGYGVHELGPRAGSHRVPHYRDVPQLHVQRVQSRRQPHGKCQCATTRGTDQDIDPRHQPRDDRAAQQGSLPRNCQNHGRQSEGMDKEEQKEEEGEGKEGW